MIQDTGKTIEEIVDRYGYDKAFNHPRDFIVDLLSRLDSISTGGGQIVDMSNYSTTESTYNIRESGIAYNKNGEQVPTYTLTLIMPLLDGLNEDFADVDRITKTIPELEGQSVFMTSAFLYQMEFTGSYNQLSYVNTTRVSLDNIIILSGQIDAYITGDFTAIAGADSAVLVINYFIPE